MQFCTVRNYVQSVLRYFLLSDREDIKPVMWKGSHKQRNKVKVH